MTKFTAIRNALLDLKPGHAKTLWGVLVWRNTQNTWVVGRSINIYQDGERLEWAAERVEKIATEEIVIS